MPVIFKIKPPPVPQLVGLNDKVVNLKLTFVFVFIVAKPLFNTFTLNEYVPIGMLPSEHIICVFNADNTLHEYIFPINTILLFRLIESNPDPVIFIPFI